MNTVTQSFAYRWSPRGDTTFSQAVAFGEESFPCFIRMCSLFHVKLIRLQGPCITLADGRRSLHSLQWSRPGHNTEPGTHWQQIGSARAQCLGSSRQNPGFSDGKTKVLHHRQVQRKSPTGFHKFNAPYRSAVIREGYDRRSLAAACGSLSLFVSTRDSIWRRLSRTGTQQGVLVSLLTLRHLRDLRRTKTQKHFAGKLLL